MTGVQTCALPILEWLGYPINNTNWADQRMGASTVAAVKKFQIKYWLKPTGVVGPVTWTTLAEAAGRGPGERPDLDGVAAAHASAPTGRPSTIWSRYSERP